MDIFGALADPVRRSLLAELAAEPCRVVDLAASRPISRPAVSKHLRLLLEAGAVTVRDAGRERYYALDRTALAPVASYVAGLAATRPRPSREQALDALETEVRRTGRERRRTAPARSTRRPHDHHTDRTGSSSATGSTCSSRPASSGRPIEDVWAAVTEPDRLARWIGSWDGDPESGSVQFRMLFEGEDHAGETMTIRVCEPPHRLHVTSQVGDEVWLLELDLSPRRRRHHADASASPA